VSFVSRETMNTKNEKTFDVIVVGGGHAGIEASLAAARMGCDTLMLTLNLDHIGQMSCNPAIGGIGKGHLVKEIDALGGEMACAIDETGIQFRMLNTRKGPAVRASRAQADKALYRQRMKRILETCPRLVLRQGSAERLIVEHGTIRGIETQIGEKFLGRRVILTTGTFLRGLIHVGDRNYSAGRAGDFAVQGLTESLINLGFKIGRLKTGTCPRLNSRSIDYSRLHAQHGDENPVPFSFSNERVMQPQIPCHITYTNRRTHEIIRAAIHRSPMYSGVINSRGPRYCPSIEDKIVRFADKNRHQIFLEPEGLDTVEVYPNGLSTSLPLDVQTEMVHSIEGLEQAEIKAAWGLRGKEPLVLSRDQAYLGVLVDDLVTKGTDSEPYRMFTSRAEYRLLLREDNADLRLTEIGHDIGLASEETCRRVRAKKNGIVELLAF